MERLTATGDRCVSILESSSSATNKRSAVAFTLVELLVVIGIIAVLISILLPTLSRARDQANAIKCLANQKQIGTAFVMYVNDHKGAMPYVVADMSWKPWTATFYATGNPNPANAIYESQLNNVHRHLMKYLGGRVRPGDAQITLQDSQIYRCPSAIDFPITGSQTPNSLGNTNYTFNGVFMRRKSNQIRRSSEFIIASESRYAWNASGMRPYPTGFVTLFPTANLDTLEYRQWLWVESGITGASNNLLNLTLHRKSSAGTVIYLDGHAAMVDYRDIRPKDFGLTDSATAGQGLESDTYVRQSANPTISYRAKLR